MKFTEKQIKELVAQFFPELPQKELEIFLSLCTYQVVKNKQTILKGERTDKRVVFLLKGVARAYSINKESLELNDYLRAEGHLVGDARVFGDVVQILDVEAIGEVHALIFDISKLESLGYTNPILMKFYLGFLKEIVVILAHRLHSFVSMSPKERYEDLIRWNPLYLKSTFDKHIASFLGIKPLTFHRIKKEYSKSIK